MKKRPPPPRTAMLSLELLSVGDEPPKEVRLFSAGTIETSKGIFKFTSESGRKVMASASKKGAEYPFDYEHGMLAFFAPDPAESGKAAGWFKPELRNGELWASDIRWTPKATQKLKDREFRYVSPAFNHTQAGEIEQLINVAITNLPATYGMDPLMASERARRAAAGIHEETDMDFAQLMALLGLTANAAESEAIAKVNELKASAGVALQLTALTGKASSAEALAIVSAWKAGSEQAVALSKQLNDLKTAGETAEKEALLSRGSLEGKIPPALKDVLRATMDATQLKAYLSAAPKVHAPGLVATEPGGGAGVTVTLTAEDLAVAKQMGTDIKALAARRAASGPMPVGTMTSPTSTPE